MSVYEVVAIEKKVEQGAIGLTFNSKLTMKMSSSNLNTSPRASPIGYVHVADSCFSCGLYSMSVFIISLGTYQAR